MGAPCLSLSLLPLSLLLLLISPCSAEKEYFPSAALAYEGVMDGGGLMMVPSLQGGSTTSVTVSAWVRIRRHKQHNLLVSTTDRKGGYAMFVDAGEKACFGVWQDFKLQVISSRTLQRPMIWHYVTGTFNGTDQVVYVDGYPGDVSPKTGASLNATTGITIGGSGDWPSLRLDGTLAAVHIWNVARTQAEIVQDMLHPWRLEVPQFSHLLAAYRFNEGGARTLYDHSPRQQHAVWTGAAVPAWTRSTAPFFMVGTGPVSLSIGEVHEGMTVEVTQLPVEGRLYETSDPLGLVTLAAITSTPFKLRVGRYLRFLPPEGVLEDGGYVCATIVLRCLPHVTMHTIDVFLAPPKGSAERRYILGQCKHQRFRDGVVELAEDATKPSSAWLLPREAVGGRDAKHRVQRPQQDPLPQWKWPVPAGEVWVEAVKSVIYAGWGGWQLLVSFADAGAAGRIEPAPPDGEPSGFGGFVVAEWVAGAAGAEGHCSVRSFPGGGDCVDKLDCARLSVRLRSGDWGALWCLHRAIAEDIHETAPPEGIYQALADEWALVMAGKHDRPPHIALPDPVPEGARGVCIGPDGEECDGVCTGLDGRKCEGRARRGGGAEGGAGGVGEGGGGGGGSGEEEALDEMKMFLENYL